jgi:hypothetical protein
MMIKIIAWLVGSKIGRYVAIFLTAIASIGLIIAYAVSNDRAKQSLKQSNARLDSIKKRVKSDDDIAKMPYIDRRRELDKWVRD